MRILVIEDEKKIAHFIRRSLKEEGYSVDVAHDGEEGHFLVSTEAYDAIVLDLMLPRLDGMTLCRQLRADKIWTPILMLSAKDTVADKVKGLDAGANDYLTKPFASEELLARIRALLRKNDAKPVTRLTVDDLEVDLLTHTVNRQGKTIELTAKEYAILEFLMKNEGNVVTRTMLSEHVWDMNFETYTNVIDVFISYLRNKIDAGFDRKLIQDRRAHV
jgi:DNA-binding response OmpR family regulator